MSLTGPLLRNQRKELGLSQAKLAELSGVPQHALSAFELEKVVLTPSTIARVVQALRDKNRLITVRGRSKRYREHTYSVVEHSADRVARAGRSAGNPEYLQVLADLSSQHVRPKDERLTALSLFSGCGGFSLGFSAAGFSVRGHLELEPDLRTIYGLNFPRSIGLGGDITHVNEALLGEWVERLGPIHAIFGGPPCQGFSLAGKRQVDDPRNVLFRHYLRFVDAFRPVLAILENVRLLTSMKSPRGTYVRDDICEEFRRHGYVARCFEINAKDYGVPQHRERAIFLAVRDDVGPAPTPPPPTHAFASDLFSSILPYRTLADACSDLSFLESGEASEDELHRAVRHPAHVIEWLWNVGEGRSAHENEDPSKRPPSGYNTTYKRQVWNQPASTVQTTFGMISGCRNVHPIATRSLTIREAARIQSFPDTYYFTGDLGAIRTGIGNAVPPLLAFHIANHAKRLLDLVEVTSF